MEKFDMGKFLAEAGVQIDTDKREQIEYVSIDLIVPDPENFYELSGLDDLAENIALLGLQQPIRVRPMPGDESQVVIISGHRRHAALKMLIEQDGRDDLRDVPCIVERGAENPKLTQLKLIYANASTRVLTSAEQAKQAEQVEKLLYELKEDGMDFPGRMRDHVAQACQVSTGKLARLKLIRSKLIPQFMVLWEHDGLRESVAYTLARQTPVRQRAVWIAQTDNGKKKFSCTDGWLESIFREMDRMEEVCAKPCAIHHTSKCDHVHCRVNRAAELAQYCAMSCRGCCIDCYNLASCTYFCEDAAQKRRELKDRAKIKKQQDDEERKAAEQLKKAAEQPKKDLMVAAYRHVAQLRRERGVSQDDFLRASLGYAYGRDHENLEKQEQGKANTNWRMPGGIWASEAERLIATADLLGCSIDYLLGRTDVRDMAQPEGAVPCACECMSTPEFIPGAWYPATVEPPVGVPLILIDSGGYVDDGQYIGSGDYTMDYGDPVVLWALMPKESDVSTHAPEKCVNFDTWHTGTPDAPGTYAAYVRIDGVGKPILWELHWDGIFWTLRGEQIDAGVQVECWMPKPAEG